MTREGWERTLKRLREHVPSTIVDYHLGAGEMPSRPELTNWFVHRLLTETIQRVEGGAPPRDALRHAAIDIDDNLDDDAQRVQFGAAVRYALAVVDHSMGDRDFDERPRVRRQPAVRPDIDPVTHARVEELRRLIRPTGSGS